MQEASQLIKRRINSVDFARGVVMMIMLLDHTREFVHAGALQNDPTNLQTTTAAIFFTRWITHFCAPVFVFLAGTSIYLQKLNGKSNAELSRFLWTRGLWLILLEFTIVRFAIVFNFDYTFFGMAQVIWVIGVSMVAMAAFVYLPVKVVGAIGVAMIALHNLFDRFLVPPQIAFAGTPPPDILQSLWIILHQPGIIPLFGGAAQVFVAYPLIPWIGVMMAGYALGAMYAWNDERRRKWLLILGGVATALFIVIRFINAYGDPAAWSMQQSPLFTFLSFINTTKYPPSLLFLLMTLGPALIVLALMDKIDGNAVWQRIGIVYGRVPMFYYILQWFVAHSAGIFITLAAGKSIDYFFMNLLEMGQQAPPDHGFSLAVAYAAWITGLIVLYPLCLYYGRFKRKSEHSIFGYL